MPYQNNHTEDPCPLAIEATTDYFEAVHQARKRRDLRWLAGALVDELRDDAIGEPLTQRFELATVLADLARRVGDEGLMKSVQPWLAGEEAVRG